MRSSLLVLFAALCAGCSSTHSNHVVQPATAEQQAVLIERVKSLAGTWQGTAPDGTVGTTVFAVTSNGTAVREIMLVGTAHEMTNMYTMDGPDLVMTHYCAMGNQPRMRAAPGSGNVITFRPDGVGNLTAVDQMYMGQMTIEFIDADHITQRWQSISGGTPSAEHDVNIELTRMK